MFEMAEARALNSVLRVNTNDLVAKNVEKNIKEEEEVQVKPEPHECAVCTSRSNETVGIYAEHTSCGTLLSNFLSKYTQNDFVASTSKQVCRSCFDLIDVLEQAELEYLKLKESFEAILSKNRLFESTSTAEAAPVKCEASDACDEPLQRGDSDDEPLVVTRNKRHRESSTRKKKVQSNAKRKTQIKKSNKYRFVPHTFISLHCAFYWELALDCPRSVLRLHLNVIFFLSPINQVIFDYLIQSRGSSVSNIVH